MSFSKKNIKFVAIYLIVLDLKRFSLTHKTGMRETSSSIHKVMVILNDKYLLTIKFLNYEKI